MPNGATGIAANGCGAHSTRYGCCATGTAASGYAGLIPWITNGPPLAVLARRAHGELVHVGLAHHHCTGVRKAFHSGGIEWGSIVLKHAA